MTEELVWIRSEDGLELAGSAFPPQAADPGVGGPATARGRSTAGSGAGPGPVTGRGRGTGPGADAGGPAVGGATRGLAVVLVHGVAGSFHSRLMVSLGRNLAARGLPTVGGDNRGHDFGAFLIRPDHSRLLGGAGWEDVREAPRDIAAWVAYACRRFEVPRVLLAGHSLGGWKVAAYGAERRDPRVAALALLSPVYGGLLQEATPELTARVAELLASGREEELVAVPNRRLERLSARALAGRAASYPGEDLPALVARAGCPVFASYGTVADIGGQAQLDRLAGLGASTRLIEGADHGYLDRWVELADALVGFAAGLAPGPVE